MLTDKGTVTGDAYVMALGSYSPLLLRKIGIDLPVYPVKGYSLTIPITDPAGAPESTVMDETHKVAMTRLGDRIRVGGMAELDGYSAKLRPSRRATLEHVITDLYPKGGDVAKASFWCGLRPMTPDGPPVIGRERYDNLYLNTGHGTLGWTMACGSGRVLADLISGRDAGDRSPGPVARALSGRLRCVPPPPPSTSPPCATIWRAHANAAPARKVVAVVKANGYGHGAARLLPALADADMLGVACIEEALALREAGAVQPLLLMEGVFEADELPLCARLGFEIAVHEPGQVAMLEAARLDAAAHRLAQGRQRHEPAGLPARGRAGGVGPPAGLRRGGAVHPADDPFRQCRRACRSRDPRPDRPLRPRGGGPRAAALLLQLGRHPRLARGACRMGAPGRHALRRRLRSPVATGATRA